ncbi:MAG: hypothetical protein KKG60_02190, partial [Nanoarchaeota archaeon]|nr:hypothetical protein [Nanoarchaeota archaeon]
MVSIKKRCVILSVFVLVWIVGFSFMCRGEDTVYDEQKALSWLELQVNGKLSVSEIALGMLAIKQGRSNMGNYVNILEAKMDSVKGCFPSGDCGFKETALAVLALKGEGKSVDKSVKWIKDNMGVARESDIGEWYLQITTDGKGDCYVYEGETQKAKLTVNGDEQISFNNKLR